TGPAIGRAACAAAAGCGRPGSCPGRWPRAAPCRCLRRTGCQRSRFHPHRQRHRQGPHAMTIELNPNATVPAPKKNGKRKRALLVVAAIVLVALAAWLLWYLLGGRWHQDTDDAYVQGNMVSITAQSAGTVVSIGADDGMKVVAGQVLVQLDPNDAKVAFEQAKANLANT